MNINKILDKIPYGTFAPLKPAHYMGMGAGVVIFIVALAWFLAWTPAQETKARLEKQLDDANKQLALYRAEGALKEPMTKDVAALYGTLLERKRQMPLATEIPQLLQKVSDIADFLAVDIASYSLQPTEDKGFYKSIPVSVDIGGGYFNTVGFFDSLQNLLRVVNITNFEMTMKPGVTIVVNEDGDVEKEEIDILHTEIKANAFAYIEGSEEAIETAEAKK